MFTLDQALPLAKQLEPKLSAVGYHLALGGSLLYKGESTKDVDFFIYPHETDKVCDFLLLFKLLTDEGLIAYRDYEKDTYPNKLAIIQGYFILDTEQITTQIKTDFFLLSRTSYVPTNANPRA